MRPTSTTFAVVAGALALSCGAAFADCKCVADGKRFEEGQVACLKLPAGYRLAQCSKVLNNSSWKILDKECPEASLPRQGEMPSRRFAATMNLE